MGCDLPVATAFKKLQFLLQYIQQISAVTRHNNLLLPIFSRGELSSHPASVSSTETKFP
jgi:hypothetical protein